MSKREDYEARVEAFLLPVMEENHFELVDVEYVKEAGTWYLRAYIDKEGGFTVDDCEMVSRRLGDWLDKEDFIDESYILEVSSPGLGRPLKKEKDFKRSMGEQVEIKLYRAVDRQKDFTGALAAYDENTVTIRYEDGSESTFDRKDIARFPEMVLTCRKKGILDGLQQCVFADVIFLFQHRHCFHQFLVHLLSSF